LTSLKANRTYGAKGLCIHRTGQVIVTFNELHIVRVVVVLFYYYYVLKLKCVVVIVVVVVVSLKAKKLKFRV
jgi:hypothetical protein